MGPLVLVVIVMMMVFVAAGAGLAVVVMVVIVVIVTAGAGLLRGGGLGYDFGGAGFVVGMAAGGHYLPSDWSAGRGWRGSGLILRRTCLSVEAVPRMYLPSMAVSTSASVWL